MSWLALSLIILAALIHASWNLLAKRAASVGPAFVFAYSVVTGVVYAPWVLYLLMTEGIPWHAQTLLCIVLSGILHVAYNLFLQRGYQVADLSVVYPIARGTGPMLSTLAAFLLLGETPTTAGVAGLLAIVGGILLISTQGRLSKFKEPASLAGVRWGGITGATIAGYTVVDAYGVKVLGLQPVVLDWLSNIVRLLSMLPWLMKHRRQVFVRMQGHWWLAIGVGVLSPLSYILVLQALKLGAPLSLTAPTREMSMMVGTLLGALILREAVGRWRLLGCLVMIVGVALLAQAP